MTTETRCAECKRRVQSQRVPRVLASVAACSGLSATVVYFVFAAIGIQDLPNSCTSVSLDILWPSAHPAAVAISVAAGLLGGAFGLILPIAESP